MICDVCGKYFKNLLNFGNYKLCQHCADKRMKRKSKKELGLKIALNIRYLTYAIYKTDEGVIELHYPFNNDDDERLLFKTLVHESVHYAIHREVSVRSSFQFDNIFRQVEEMEDDATQ